MACTYPGAPSRSRRTVVVVGVESVPGCQRTAFPTGSVPANSQDLAQMILYENFNPVQPEFDTIPLNRAREGLGPEGFGIGLGTYRFSGSVYVVGHGSIKNVPPPWATILRACGWKETRYTLNSNAPAIVTPNTTTTATASASGGSMDDGPYSYKFSLIDSGVETAVSDIACTDTVAASSGNGSVVLDWSGEVALAVAKPLRIYRSKRKRTSDVDATPLVSDSYFFIGSVPDASAATGVTSFTDVINDDDLGDPTPTAHASFEKIVWVPGNGASSGTYGLYADPPSQAAITGRLTDHDSLTIHSYLDHRPYVATGVRGTMTFTIDAGQPVRGDMDLMGVYNDPGAQAVNPSPLSFPGVPPRAVSMGLTITPQGGSALTGIIAKSMTIDLGTQVSRRTDVNQAEGLIEYAITQEYVPRWTMQVEVLDGTNNWIKEFKDGTKYKITAQVAPPGAGAGQTITFTADAGGTNYNAQLASAPTFDDVDGIRVMNLEFMLGETDDATVNSNFLTIEHS